MASPDDPLLCRRDSNSKIREIDSAASLYDLSVIGSAPSSGEQVHRRVELSSLHLQDSQVVLKLRKEAWTRCGP